MNSVLLHDPDQTNQHAGRYAVGLTGVYQTLHDRLLEALQKWVPPEETSNDSTEKIAHSPHLAPSPTRQENPDTQTPPASFVPVSVTGVQLDLANLQLLLTKSVQSSIAAQSANHPSKWTILSGLPDVLGTTTSNDSCDALSTKDKGDTQVLRPANLYSPLSVCTAGPQHQPPESITTRLLTNIGQAGQPRNGLLMSHAGLEDSSEQPKPTVTTSNLLHQLLSGADVTQVRNRSGLLEPSLCNRQNVDVKTIQHNARADNLTPKESVMDCASGEKCPPPAVSNRSFAHSPMDTAISIDPGFSIPETPSIQQPISGVVAPNKPQSIPNPSNLVVEKLLYLLIELQKNHAAGNLASVPTTVSPRANTSPCSATIEGPGTPSSLNSPVGGILGALPNSSSTPTPTATPDINNSVHCLRQLLSSGASDADVNNLSAKWYALGLSLPQHTDQNQQPGPCSLVHSDNKNNSPYVVPALNPDSNCEPRPRSKSDIPSTARLRRLRRSRDFRSHSQTKPEHPDGRASEEFAESETESTCELESSLFAQLILSPDSPASSSSHQTGNSKMLCSNSQRELRNTSGSQSATSSRDSIRSPIRSIATNLTPMVSTKSGTMTDDPPSSPPPPLTCYSVNRTQVFEWLRESDLFVAEHCFDIPLGALLATAISPGRSQWAELCCSALLTPNPPADPLPGLAKHVVNKLWHQLLLIALIENNFRPQCVTVPTGSQVDSSFAPSVCRALPDSRRRHLAAQPLRDKVLNAISSLAALDMEESPAPDAHLVAELDQLISEGARLKLTPGLFRLIRFCILAQNAYPHHFSTTYSEALSELEMELTSTPGAPALTDVLKLLIHLHCFDAGTLKQFFSLSSDPIGALHNSSMSGTGITVSPSGGSYSDVNHPSSGCALGNCKRKANEVDDLTMISHRDVTTQRDHSPIQVRSRAYTTTGCNKSARLSTTVPGLDSESTGAVLDTAYPGRPRSDTVPRTGRHPRRAERSWRYGIR